jgi:hypothetical protein
LEASRRIAAEETAGCSVRPREAFCGDGRVATDFMGGGEDGQSMVVQSDGKILVAGRSGKAFALARYRAGGKLDLSFSDDGKLTSFIGGTTDGQSI